MKIYLAGKYSANNILDCLNNIHDGIKKGAEILKKGDVVFCPFIDFLFQFFDKTLTIEDYYRYSMSFLEGWADEIWVLPDWENSEGTKKEIARANELKIPVRFL